MRAETAGRWRSCEPLTGSAGCRHLASALTTTRDAKAGSVTGQLTLFPARSSAVQLRIPASAQVTALVDDVSLVSSVDSVIGENSSKLLNGTTETSWMRIVRPA